MSRVPRLLLLAPLLLPAAFALALTDAPPAAAGEPDEVTLTLLHNNDGESFLLPLTNTVEADGVTVDLPVAGIAAYKAVVEREIAEARAAGHAVLNVYAGDAFLPGATFLCGQMDGNPLFNAVAQRAIPYDVHIIGNHEFDSLPDFLARFIRAFGDQPFLSANLDFSGESAFGDLVDGDGLIEGAPEDGRVVARALIVTDEGTGARFGLVGATTPRLPHISAPRNVRVTPDLAATAAAVQAEIDRLHERGVTRIILGAHMEGVAPAVALAALLRGVDVLVAGGGDEVDDLLQNPAVDSALQTLPGEHAAVEGDYPVEATDAAGRTVYVVTTTGHYEYAGRLDVVFDAEGEVARVVSASSYPRPVVPASEAAAALGFAGAVGKDAGLVAEVEAPLRACLDGFAATVVAATEVPLDVSSESLRTRESNAGNLVADAFLHAYDRAAADLGLPARGPGNPVIAVQNGGGIRQNAGDVLPVGGAVPGDIFLANTFDVLPFANTVTLVRDVSPADLKAVFELSVSRYPDAGHGGFLQVGGIAAVFDPARPAGERVVSLTLDGGAAIVANGAVVAGAPAVGVLTNGFIAAGGDAYAMFAANPDQLQIAPSYEGAWRDYLAHLGTIRADDPRYAPGGEGRLVFLAVSPAPADTGAGLASASAPPAAVATALALVLASALGALARRRRSWRRGG